MIVDSNVHWLPETLFKDKELLESFLHAVPRAFGQVAYVTDVPGKNLKQIIIEIPKGNVVLNYAENQYTAEGQVQDMDKAGIDKAVFRIPCWQEWLSLDLCKKVNDMMAAHIKKFPKRFMGLATVPPWGDSGSLKEVERCIKDLGFVGVQMAAHYGTLYLDEPEFTAYFDKLNKLDIPVVVHHTPIGVDRNSILKYTNIRRQYGRCVDQATAVGRELFSGLFERFPNLKLSHSMLGGGFFAYADMLIPQSTEKSKLKDEVDRFEAPEEKIRGYLEKNLFFDMSGAVQWGKAQLECAIKVFGADHILFGTSYPIRRDWFFQGMDYIKSLAISDKEKEQILGGNAVKLFKIKA